MSEPARIRNVAVVGHRGTGKTSLVEALLFQTGKINRLGTVARGRNDGVRRGRGRAQAAALDLDVARAPHPPRPNHSVGRRPSRRLVGRTTRDASARRARTRQRATSPCCRGPSSPSCSPSTSTGSPRARQCHDGEGPTTVIAQNASAYCELAESRSSASRRALVVLALLLGLVLSWSRDRPDPADRCAARHDRGSGDFSGPRRRERTATSSERSAREREPDERRARPPVPTSSRRRAGTSPSSWRACRTSSERR